MFTLRKAILTPDQVVRVEHDGACVALHPTPDTGSDHLAEVGLRMSYRLNYGSSAAIPPQFATVALTPDSFSRELANCRTFLLDSEVAALHAQGVGRHLSARDLLVFSHQGVLNNQLRWANEPARHKILDLIGDLSLTGCEWAGHVVAYRSGHAMNVALAQALVQALSQVRSEEPGRASGTDFCSMGGQRKAA
jgi:UDP-3-O-acyl-N-acetylglucosamine deacetylase